MDVQEGYFYTRVATNDVLVTTGDFGFSVRNYETDDSWQEGDSPTGAWHPPAIAGETLVIPCDTAGGIEEKDGVYGFDLEDGTERWQFTHPDIDVGDVSGGFVLSGETIYVLGGDRLQALRPETEESEDEEPDDESEDETEDDESEDETEDDEPEDEQEDDEPEDETENDEPEDDGESESDEPTEEQPDEDEAADEQEDDADDSPDDGSAGEDGGHTGEADDDETDEGGTDDEPAEPTDDETDESGTDDEPAEPTDDGADDTENGADEDDADSGGDEDDGDADGVPDDADGTPGFTTGAGILGGALGLEWLRRRSDATDSSDERSSDER